MLTNREKLINNNKKLEAIRKGEIALYRTTSASMLAIFATGVSAFTSFVTPIPTAQAFCAYGISNLVFFGLMAGGITLEAKKDKIRDENSELIKQEAIELQKQRTLIK